MNNYTVILYEKDEPRIETNWTSYRAAVAFAQKIFIRKSVITVKIWEGFAPDDPDNMIKQHDALLYIQERGTETVTMDLGESGKLLYPKKGD